MTELFDLWPAALGALALGGIAFGLFRQRSSERARTASDSHDEARQGHEEVAGGAAAREGDAQTRPAARPTSVQTDTAALSDKAALASGLQRSRSGFMAQLRRVLGNAPSSELSAAWVEEVEAVCLGADIGVSTVDKIIDGVSSQRQADPTLSMEHAVRAVLKDLLVSPGISASGSAFGAHSTAVSGRDGTLKVILLVGVNGAGKTTTAGKLAAHLASDGSKVVLAAGDTYRAAALEQLAGWSRRVGVELFTSEPGRDPAAVLYDAVKSAQAQGAQWLIADTAGRLHTKAPLMDELARVGKSLAKARDGQGADETLLVVDATTGQNGLLQAREFHAAAPLTGVVLTKMDGTAKGGIAFSISDGLGLPIRFVGVGERTEDLLPFDPSLFIEALFEDPQGISH